MQEKQVTIGDETFKLDRPFLIMATQNQLNKKEHILFQRLRWIGFMLKTVIDYPKMDEEQLIIRANLIGDFGNVQPVVTLEQIIRAQQTAREVYMDEKIEKYILDIIFATR